MKKFVVHGMFLQMKIHTYHLSEEGILLLQEQLVDLSSISRENDTQPIEEKRSDFQTSVVLH